MGQAAHVRSLDALDDLRLGLKRFGAQATEELERARQRVVNLAERVEERLGAARRELEQSEEELHWAQRDYDDCQQDEDRACSSEAERVDSARYSVERARDRLDRCRAWRARLERAAEAFFARVRGFREMEQTTLSEAALFLQQRRDRLDVYTGAASASGAGSAVSTPTAGEVEGSAATAGQVDRVLALVGSGKRAVLERRLRGYSQEQRAALQEVLDHPKADPRAVAKALGTGRLDEEMAAALPVAMAKILRARPDIGGLFVGMSLRDGYSALDRFDNGKAFEILATAKRLELTEGPLAIRAEDQISFGAKSQARYARKDEVRAEILAALQRLDAGREKSDRTGWAEFRSPRKTDQDRRTVESDLHLGRRSVYGWQESLQDYKYSGAKVAHPKIDDQLLGIGVALATGELDDAHFIVSTKLGSKRHRQVEDLNLVLKSKPWGIQGAVEIHENFDWRPASA